MHIAKMKWLFQPQSVYVASFPGLPHLQFLITCSMQAIKNWRCGRPGNEASVYDDLKVIRCYHAEVLHERRLAQIILQELQPDLNHLQL